STEKSGSTRAEPVKYSACPWLDGCEPLRAIVMFCIFLFPRLGWAFAVDRIRNERSVLTIPGQRVTMKWCILLLLPERPDGRENQRAVYPPSTARACPMTKPAPGLQSHSTAEAISSGLPRRPIGCSFVMSFIVSGSLAIIAATIGVSMAPGHMALMRMPRAAYSRAALFVRPITPCL